MFLDCDFQELYTAHKINARHCNEAEKIFADYKIIFPRNQDMDNSCNFSLGKGFLFPIVA